MIQAPVRAVPQGIIQWQSVSRNNFQVVSGRDIFGKLRLSLEPSILFSPNQCEYYRAAAETADCDSLFNCVFKDGQFEGCVAIEEEAGQPLTFYKEQPAQGSPIHASWIVLCQEGTVLLWLPGRERGEWVVRRKGHRILDVWSAAPQASGFLRVYDPSLIVGPIGRTLILFSIYLSIGPRRSIHG
jgi:hypothetical protein